jgi:hypothetical protein
VAINVEPEILLVDEVLSVGDESFQRKCINRVHDLQREGRTIVLVTHAASLVRQIADRAAVLDHGRLVTVDEPDEAIARFRETLAHRGIALLDSQVEGATETAEDPEPEDTGPRWSPPPEPDAVPVLPVADVDGPVTITTVKVEYPDPEDRFLFANTPMRLRIDYVATERLTDVAVNFTIVDDDDTIIAGTDTQGLLQPIVTLEGVGAVCFDFADVAFHDGHYRVHVAITDRAIERIYAERNTAATFDVMIRGTQQGIVSVAPTVVHFFNHPIEGQEPDASPADGAAASVPAG